jgi:HAMP domain-containing protein
MNYSNGWLKRFRTANSQNSVEGRVTTFWTINRKILLPVLIVILLLTMGLTINNYVKSSQQYTKQEKDNLSKIQVGALTEIESLNQVALALAVQASQNPDVQAAFAAGDRERITQILLPTYLAANKQFAVKQFVLHSPPAIAFLRLQQLDKFGDDLSDIRKMVVVANAEETAVQGIEMGRAGLGVRGVVPVTYEGRHIGLVDVGIDIGQSLLDTIKKNYNADSQFLLDSKTAEAATFEGFVENAAGPTETLLLQASTLTEPIYTEKDVYARVMTGEEIISYKDANGRNYAILSIPIRDYSNTIVGVLEILLDRTDTLAERNRELASTIVISLFAIFLSVVIIISSVNTITKPIGALTETAIAVSNGHLEREARVESNDEVGVLTIAFNKMVADLRSTLATLEERVAARTKDLATVANISTNTAVIRDPYKMLEAMVHLTQRGFNLYHAHVFRYEKESNDLHIVACGYREGDEHEGTHGTTFIPVSQEQSLVARAARTKKPVIVNDVRSDPGWLPNPLLPETRSEMAVPMLVGDELLGVMDVQADHVNAFSEEDANIQLTLAAQTATSYQSTLAYEKSQEQAKLETLINTIGQKIQRATTVEDTLQTAIREIGIALDASRVHASISRQGNKNDPGVN